MIVAKLIDTNEWFQTRVCDKMITIIEFCILLAVDASESEQQMKPVARSPLSSKG